MKMTTPSTTQRHDPPTPLKQAKLLNSLLLLISLFFSTLVTFTDLHAIYQCDRSDLNRTSRNSYTISLFPIYHLYMPFYDLPSPPFNRWPRKQLANPHNLQKTTQQTPTVSERSTHDHDHQARRPNSIPKCGAFHTDTKLAYTAPAYHSGRPNNTTAYQEQATQEMEPQQPHKLEVSTWCRSRTTCRSTSKRESRTNLQEDVYLHCSTQRRIPPVPAQKNKRTTKRRHRADLEHQQSKTKKAPPTTASRIKYKWTKQHHRHARLELQQRKTKKSPPATTSNNKSSWTRKRGCREGLAHQ